MSYIFGKGYSSVVNFSYPGTCLVDSVMRQDFAYTLGLICKLDLAVCHAVYFHICTPDTLIQEDERIKAKTLQKAKRTRELMSY